MSAKCTQEVKALQASSGMCGSGAFWARKGQLLRRTLAAFIALYHDPSRKHAGAIADVRGGDH
jgi:hypothetical protein